MSQSHNVCVIRGLTRITATYEKTKLEKNIRHKCTKRLFLAETAKDS